MNHRPRWPWVLTVALGIGLAAAAVAIQPEPAAPTPAPKGERLGAIAVFYHVSDPEQGGVIVGPVLTVVGNTTLLSGAYGNGSSGLPQSPDVAVHVPLGDVQRIVSYASGDAFLKAAREDVDRQP